MNILSVLVVSIMHDLRSTIKILSQKISQKITNDKRFLISSKILNGIFKS
jgi:hypothetical protein